MSASYEEIMEYWVEKSPHSNYVAGEMRSKIMVDLVKERWPDRSISILEPGCNIGRNLHFLMEAGYKNLYGIEVSPRVLEPMQEHFPDVFESTVLWNTRIEDCIASFDDDQFDVIVTMAVLEHIHPESEWVFDEMARIAKLGIVTIEDEKHPHSHLIFQRNYREIFEGLGMTQDFERNCSEYPIMVGDFGRSAKRHWARRFVW